MNGYDGNGGAVKGYSITPGDAQDVTVTALSNCGGTVTASCPFSPSSLNNNYIGDSIVSITNDANGMTYRSNSAGTGMVEASGGGDGQVWVQDGSLSGSIPSAVFINVYATNLGAQIVWACTEGSGAQVALSTTYQGANCAWQEVNGS